MRTYIRDRPLGERTDEEQRLVEEEGAPREVYRLARLSVEIVTPWQLPQISPESVPIGLTHAGPRATVIETNYVVDWQLRPARDHRSSGPDVGVRMALEHRHARADA